MGALVLAHRGVTEAGPDNSIPAFEALKGVAVDGLEFDVRVTADDVPIATHDPTIGGRLFESLTLKEVRALQGEGIATPHRIPSLAEVLEALPEGLTVNLELKSERVGPALTEAIDGMHERFSLLVTSFDARPLVELHASLPSIATGLINSVPIADPIASVRACGAGALSSHWRLVDAGLVESLEKHEIALYVWTVNEDAAILRMNELGVGAIITDRPRAALTLLGRHP